MLSALPTLSALKDWRQLTARSFSSLIIGHSDTEYIHCTTFIAPHSLHYILQLANHRNRQIIVSQVDKLAMYQVRLQWIHGKCNRLAAYWLNSIERHVKIESIQFERKSFQKAISLFKNLNFKFNLKMLTMSLHFPCDKEASKLLDFDFSYLPLIARKNALFGPTKHFCHLCLILFKLFRF